MDNRELFDALALLEKERGIPADYMLSQIQKAIVIACKNTYGGNEDVDIIMDKDTGKFEVYLLKTVVEEVEDPNREIMLDQARKLDPSARLEEKVRIELDPKQFGRIAVQTSRSIIRQGIRDGEKGQMLLEFQSRNQEIVTATVERIDPKSGAVTLKIGKAEAVLPKSEQVNGEEFREGEHIKVYIVDVRDGEKGPRAILSRTHPDFVKRLFETEVPEIFDGTVEIKSVSREAGSRTKMAVSSRDSNVDPVGACIGARGTRVAAIVGELGGEKIDIIEYDESPEKFIAAALSPANVISVVPAADGTKVCKVTVPDGQLSLAIGNKGQNVRLAAKLTGWKIDIRPESGFYGEEEEEEQPAPVPEQETSPQADAEKELAEEKV
ncbi:MAG TPA: transcription termination/antitermination protein NusA [Candidatus Scatavimonas merdigallinarum]|uniref:Transcription termination/antitermination protein NusA n=1 Tax=Candidatus Scatavimonas merdigallinarum TaxID=2840914 RepID=A0A9D1CV47_9FIRM|nr:transcription termination/antitermination protein NusA [Candidatus Scatavimonas merdigallinarum]